MGPNESNWVHLGIPLSPEAEPTLDILFPFGPKPEISLDINSTLIHHLVNPYLELQVSKILQVL